ncbi:hypothetical protein HK1_02016 [Tepidibacillus sp. HK-1]|nr:hypothetical protein HK1_02016 [Tepidibacillus sp. HK-1]
MLFFKFSVYLDLKWYDIIILQNCDITLNETIKEVQDGMEYSLPTFTWFWLYVPMSLLVVFSMISYFLERREE